MWRTIIWGLICPQNGRFLSLSLSLNKSTLSFGLDVFNTECGGGLYKVKNQKNVEARRKIF